MVKGQGKQRSHEGVSEQVLRHKKLASGAITGPPPIVGGGDFQAENIMSGNSRGDIVINPQLCKGCSLCTVACAPGVLVQSNFLNRQGYYAIAYTGSGCTGCGVCFYVCPEPGAITVRKRKDASLPSAKPGREPAGQESARD